MSSVSYEQRPVEKNLSHLCLCSTNIVEHKDLWKIFRFFFDDFIKILKTICK